MKTFDIKSLTLILTFLLAMIQFQPVSGADFSQWIAVDSEGRFLINQKTFPRDRHLRKALEIQNFYSMSSDGVSSFELFTEYDCKKGSFRLLSHRAFSAPDLKGGMVYNWQSFDPRAYVGIPADSPAEKVYKLVCGKEKKT